MLLGIGYITLLEGAVEKKGEEVKEIVNVFLLQEAGRGSIAQRGPWNSDESDVAAHSRSVTVELKDFGMVACSYKFLTICVTCTSVVSFVFLNDCTIAKSQNYFLACD